MSDVATSDVVFRPHTGYYPRTRIVNAHMARITRIGPYVLEPGWSSQTPTSPGRSAHQAAHARPGGSSKPASKYFPTTAEQDAISDDHRTSLEFSSPGRATTKSSYNRLAAEPLRRT
jgi:hypothetical protein